MVNASPIVAFHSLLSLLLLPICLGVPSLVFNQRIDHFGDRGTFKQRYIYSTKFVKPSKTPQLVVIDVRGEEDEKEMSDFTLDVHRVGFGTQSIMAALEHRFYGGSFPSTSPTTRNLFELLTVEQAIADLVSFREYLIRTYGLARLKFVLMGCSYAGSLAAWARVQHPDLFLGAIASCPVLNLKYDFPEYLDGVGAAYALPSVGGSSECEAFMKQASGIIREKLVTPAGRRELETIFGLRLNYLEDVNTRLLWSEGTISLRVLQTNDPFCRQGLCDIKKRCDFIARSDVSSKQKVLSVFVRIAPRQTDMEIQQDYAQYITWLKDRSNLHADRLTVFQTCSQWVLFQSCNPGSKCPFIQHPAILGIKQKICQDAFGLSEANIKQRIDAKNKEFANLKKTKNIFVILGELDPWKAAGEIITSQPGPTQYEVPKAGHCYWTNAGSTRLAGINEMLGKTVETVQSWLKADDK